MDMKSFYLKLAENMRIERARRKISQLNLATKAGVSVDTINMIERGIGNPTLYTIVSIALALEVDLNTLLPLNNSNKI